MTRERLLELGRWWAQALGDLAQGLREKGPRHFSRLLAVCAVILFAVYRFVYLWPAGRLQAVQAGLREARAAARYTERYNDLRARLDGFNSTLPVGKDKEHWLSEAVRDAMKAEGILFTSLSPVTQKAQGSFVVLSLTVGCRASYKQLGSWIDRLERSKTLLHVSQLDLSKDRAEMGSNQVSLTVSTVIPKEGEP